MDIRKLQRVIVDALEDVKAQNIVVFNTEHLSALFERVVVASGTSSRQTKSLASSVREAVKTAGYPVPRTEGEGNGEWIIVDCGVAVVHVMQPTIRDYYHLEEIWGDKPVNMKIATGTTKLVKAAEPDAPAKKAAAKKAPAAKTPARAPAKTPARAPAKKAPAKGIPVVKKMMIVGKPAAKKKPAAPIGRGVTRTVGVKSAAAKSAPAKKAPAKKAPARKTPGRA